MTPTTIFNVTLVCACGMLDCPFGYGFCHCGCGKPTLSASKTNTRAGNLKGIPQKYLCGHNRKVRPIIEVAKSFKIDGVYCRLISLTQGQYAIVDDTDYEWLMQWKWFAQRHSNNEHCFYARRTERNGGKRGLLMHRQIAGLESEYVTKGDHISGVTLDNRRLNLRDANKYQNAINRRKNKNNTSGFTGVYKTKNKWTAEIHAHGKRIRLGQFYDLDKAVEVRSAAVNKYHGEFTRNYHGEI